MKNITDNENLKEHYFTEDDEDLVIFESENPLAWIRSDKYVNITNNN